MPAGAGYDPRDDAKDSGVMFDGRATEPARLLGWALSTVPAAAKAAIVAG